MKEAFLAELHKNYDDDLTWFALADWLDENFVDDRFDESDKHFPSNNYDRAAELIRLHRNLRCKRKYATECELINVLDSGVHPVVPEIVNSVGMRFALIPAGTFLMGSSVEEVGHCENEGPQCEVTISKAFYLGVFQVTQDQWQQIMGDNPSRFCPKRDDSLNNIDTRDFPVEHISWEDTQTFLRKLEEKEGRKYRLPSEAEWEYACRGDLSSVWPYNTGSDLTAHFSQTIPSNMPSYSGVETANTYGLYHMHGNVWEWCNDNYFVSPSLKVGRGGCYDSENIDCRSARRCAFTSGSKSSKIGFRALLES